MPENSSDFGSLIIEAARAVTALDDLTRRDNSKAASRALSDGASVYSRLLEYQRAAWMTAAENESVQSAVEFLRSRLRFFGQSV